MSSPPPIIYSEVMSFAIRFSKILINKMLFMGINDNIIQCNQTLHYYHEFVPPIDSNGCGEIVREYLVRGWMVCRDYPPQPHVANPPMDYPPDAYEFKYGRNWQVTLGYDGENPENMASWFVLSYTDRLKNCAFYGYSATNIIIAQLMPKRLDKFLIIYASQHPNE